MKQLSFLTILLISSSSGFYINENIPVLPDKSDQYHEGDKYADIINSWIKVKNKFQTFADAENSNSQQKERFNELEALEMIPSIIDHYRDAEINEYEGDILAQIYGSLWTIIMQEAKREPNEKINPILKALFDSLYLGKGSNEDIEGNTVIKLNRKANKPRHKLFLHINKEDHPSQRILSIAAMLIHYNRNNLYGKGDHGLSEGTNKVDKLNMLKSISVKKSVRAKRNVNIRLSDNELLLSRLDTLLKVTRDEVDSADFESEYDDDYTDQGLESDVANTKTLDEFYNDNYEYDESVGYPSPKSDYGSFRDLIFLAAKHRLRREREETKLKARHFFEH